MAGRKNKKQRRGRPAKSPAQILLERKARAFLKAEKEYWEQRHSLRHQYGELANQFSLEAEKLLPPELSSTVWGLIDGVAFVRHKPVKGYVGVSFRSLHWTLEKWSKEGPILPLEDGDLSMGKSGFGIGLSNSTLVNCMINEIEIPYGEFLFLRYGEGDAL